jgi:hypothetical protein
MMPMKKIDIATMEAARLTGMSPVLRNYFEPRRSRRLRLEAVSVMQTAEDRRRRNTVAVWKPMSG